MTEAGEVLARGEHGDLELSWVLDHLRLAAIRLVGVEVVRRLFWRCNLQLHDDGVY